MHELAAIYHSGSSDAVKCLQEIFAKQVLGLNQLSPCKKDAYELDELKHKKFQFKLRPESGLLKKQVSCTLAFLAYYIRKQGRLSSNAGLILMAYMRNWTT